jgi:hypothetical protein
MTFDDCSDEESDDDDEDDDDQSSEEIIGLDNSSTSKSTTKNKKRNRPFKRNLSNSSITIARDKSYKRLCNKLSTSEDIGNKEIIMLLKTLLLTNNDLAGDMNELSKDVKNLMVMVEKIDHKLNVVYDNQKKMQRALTKRKVKT